MVQTLSLRLDVQRLLVAHELHRSRHRFGARIGLGGRTRSKDAHGVREYFACTIDLQEMPGENAHDMRHTLLCDAAPVRGEIILRCEAARDAKS